MPEEGLAVDHFSAALFARQIVARVVNDLFQIMVSWANWIRDST
jgi:hypothetical protein